MSKQQSQSPDENQITKPLSKNKKKVKKPFELWHIWDRQWSRFWKSGEYLHGRYKTLELAEIVKGKMERSYASFKRLCEDKWEIRIRKNDNE